ncbi:hypothetical protein CDD83_1471 [Cordyceps sp. RAO-2017]|nr:hypothetical protein CDD83_1471 [Cordyceps sp. RAO-2017]
MESPPKRITRARAAAKADEPTAKPTRIVTAAARARTTGTATASTKSTAAKRKTRADENDNDNEEGNQRSSTARRALRARPKRAVETQEDAPVAAKATRARTTLAKRPVAESSRKQADENDAEEPVKPRGRPRKPSTAETKEPAAEPVKMTTRSRTTAAKTASTTAARPAAKKTVTFQEPDKENVEPRAKAKEPATTSLRGRPARRGGAASAAAAGRPSTRTTAAAPTSSRKKPLSPKKVTQMPISRDSDSSEDELAMDRAKTPVKAMMMSPIRPPTGAASSVKKAEPAHDEEVNAAPVTAPIDDGALGVSSLGSPPRRLPSSPLKDSLKSPAKRMGPAPPPPGSAVTAAACHGDWTGQMAGHKSSLLQSAAKRPRSPIKGLALPPISTSSPQRTQSAVKSTMFQSPAKRAMPILKPLTEPRLHGAQHPVDPSMTQPVAVATPTRPATGRTSQKLMAEEQTDEGLDDDTLFGDSIEGPAFSGRLSALLPRHIDPALQVEAASTAMAEDERMEVAQHVAEGVESADVADEAEQQAAFLSEQQDAQSDCVSEQGDDDPMALDDIVAEMEESEELSPQASGPSTDRPSEHEHSMYQLRQKDLDPCRDLDWDSESDDELDARVKDVAPTPGRGMDLAASPLKARNSRRSTIGLSSLAEQFGSWSTVSPAKPGITGAGAEAGGAPEVEASSAAHGSVDGQDALGECLQDEASFKGDFFEDEMFIHADADLEAKESFHEDSGEEDGVEDPSLNDIMITDEDVALAQEADDLSVLEPQQIETVVNGRSFDDSLSEASQEYGDENQQPNGPAPEGQPAALVTPVRPQVQVKTFFTTTKVPLKPADESSPSPLKKRSMSAPRVTSRRPTSLSRSATVISYSPTKDKKTSGGASAEDAAPVAPLTPSKTDIWSTIGTPARTPRRDVNPALLRGAVVFVDVHTTEGADASGIFSELLSQMGARCVKTWHWNPTSAADGEASSGKVGITHVVYKDGGKRTLEKVRWANGSVHCVGVSWVLDCERENEWLDEGPYYTDTNQTPRGGARRRKSMEPKTLAGLHGTAASSPTRGASRTPNTPANRRDSTLWMRAPSDQDELGGDEGEDEDLEWSCVLLTPVPKTPAPEAVARYAAELPGTPGGDGGDSPSPSEQHLMTRTCPPKHNQYRDMGEGIIGRDKDEQAVLRLMAARRKSLQFAPKIGSPLAKTWD